MRKRILKLIFCKILKFHNWSSPALDGLTPDAIIGEFTQEKFIEAFNKHITMSCMRCGVESEVSKEWREKIIERMKNI